MQTRDIGRTASWGYLVLTALCSAVIAVRPGGSQGQPAAEALRQPVSHYEEAALSQAAYPVRKQANVRVPMRDGITLSTDIFRPDAPGRFPALLVRTPYGRASAQSAATAQWFATRGYAVIQQDVRGRYDSDGVFYAFRNEADDGYDTDEWIGKQPWFDGNLGTMGGSYVGYVQWAQAVRGSKHLKAMAASVTTPDIYGNWIYVGGALHFGFVLPWGGVDIDGRVDQIAEGNDWNAMFLHLPIASADETAYHRTPHYRDWVAHPTRDRYWDGISLETEYGKVGVPVLSIDGWYDIFLRGALQDDREVRAKGRTPEARTGKRLIIGPWAHSTGGRVALTNGRAGGAPEDPLDFGDHAVVNMNMVNLRWFDYWLKGIQNGVATEPPIKIFVMGKNYWRYENEWPPARAQYTRYYIRSSGRANSLFGEGELSTETPKTPGQDTFTYNPARPAPSRGGNVCCSTVPSGPWDQRGVEMRDDVLVYTSAVLKDSVEVTGPIALKLFAATSAADTDWTAKLVDVHPNGFAQNIQSGIIRARYREGEGKPATPIQPGKVYEYTIDLWATSHVFLPGHRMRLEISSSDFPRFDRNLNTGEDAGSSIKMEVAQQTVFHGPEYPSHLVLPVIPVEVPKAATGTRAGGPPRAR